MTLPRVLTRPLEGSPLARAAADLRLADWYRPRPRTTGEWRAHAEAIRHEFSSGDWLDRVLPAISPGGEAASRLMRSARGHGIVVTTGQQPGLFGGPIYTWTKAYSALALADALQAVTGMPVAPVFWASTDDADFAEASVTRIAVIGGLETLTLPPLANAGRSMRDVPLGDVSTLLREVERGAGAAAYPEALDAVREAYSAETTVGGAYVALLRRLLEPLGIAVLDAGHIAVRAAGRDVLAAALREARRIEAALQARERAIVAAGYEPQVASVDDLSLVFETRGGRRQRVSLAMAEMAAARVNDGALGPNVLLRPVLERAVLPTAAYVGGPGEIAYFAQVSAVADAIEQPTPLIVPRWSGLIIEPHILRILDRYRLELSELQDPHAAEDRLARQRLRDTAAAALERFRAQLAESSRELSEALDGPAPLVSARVIEGARRMIAHRLDRLERRVLAAVKRQQAEVMRDVATARAALFPLGRTQERVLNMIPLLTRQGPRLTRTLIDHASEHARVLMGTGESVSDDLALRGSALPLSGSQAPP